MIDYTDSYLKTRVTPGHEARAYTDVDNYGNFPSLPVNWRDRLTMLRAYVLCCLDLGGAPDDVFAMKLKHYRQEFDEQLRQAIQAKNAAALPENRVPVFSIPLERN